jgi:hypothetical protein
MGKHITKDHTKSCKHTNVKLISPHEFIRKYKCENCGGIMMCECDKDFAYRYLSHQISETTDGETFKRIKVTEEFQKDICNKCRNLPETPFPENPGYGSASKIKRYYWREIYFETTIRYHKWLVENGYKDDDSYRMDLWKTKRHEIEKIVIQEFNTRHKINPKYDMTEESEAEFLKNNPVNILTLKAKIEPGDTKGMKSKINEAGKLYSPEEYAAKYLRSQGYGVILSESVPFHVLFATYMFLLIEDPADEQNQFVGFGDRIAFDKKVKGEIIHTFLPRDFGTKIYSKRRRKEINKHLKFIGKTKEEVISIFDYWLGTSENFRQYLWAYKEEDVQKARDILNILSLKEFKSILKYLIENYWGRYLGWPDLFMWKEDKIEFAEVKARSDKLSPDQKRWIIDNSSILGFPFRIIKILKQVEN